VVVLGMLKSKLAAGKNWTAEEERRPSSSSCHRSHCCRRRRFNEEINERKQLLSFIFPHRAAARLLPIVPSLPIPIIFYWRRRRLCS
jgi:hypothetical protein